ncbi:MAG: hypothetical protein MMC33_006099 [Icmadophila ericetorum]|nr:hypothetical protein [Icmadophila ericetorum]
MAGDLANEITPANIPSSSRHKMKAPNTTYAQNVDKISDAFSKATVGKLENKDDCVCPEHVLQEHTYIVAVVTELEHMVRNSAKRPLCLAMPVITHIAQMQDITHRERSAPKAGEFDKVCMQLASGIHVPGGGLSSHPPDAVFEHQYLSETTPIIQRLRTMFPVTPLELFDQLLATRVALNFIHGVAPSNLLERSSFREEMDAVIKSFKSKESPAGEVLRTPGKARALLGLGSFSFNRVAASLSVETIVEEKEKQADARERINDLKGALHNLFTHVIILICDSDVDGSIAVVENVVRYIFNNPDNYG